MWDLVLAFAHKNLNSNLSLCSWCLFAFSNVRGFRAEALTGACFPWKIPFGHDEMNFNSHLDIEQRWVAKPERILFVSAVMTASDSACLQRRFGGKPLYPGQMLDFTGWAKLSSPKSLSRQESNESHKTEARVRLHHTGREHSSDSVWSLLQLFFPSGGTHCSNICTDLWSVSRCSDRLLAMWAVIFPKRRWSASKNTRLPEETRSLFHCSTPFCIWSAWQSESRQKLQDENDLTHTLHHSVEWRT